MSTATIRIPEQKRDILKIIAGPEKREMKEILSDLIHGVKGKPLDRPQKMIYVYAIFS